jgi:hypothetical protein
MEHFFFDIVFIIVGLLFVYIMDGISVRNPRLIDDQKISELNTHIIFRIIGGLLICLGLLSITVNIFILAQFSLVGFNLHIVGFGLYIYDFKPSYSPWWIKIFKAFGILLFFTISSNIGNILKMLGSDDFYSSLYTKSNLFFILIYIVLVFLNWPKSKTEYEKRAYLHNAKLRSRSDYIPMVSEEETVVLNRETKIDNYNVVYHEEEVDL